MIWTLEAAAPWRILALDREANQSGSVLAGVDAARRSISFLDQLHPDDRAAVTIALADATARGESTCRCRLVQGSGAVSGRLDCTFLTPVTPPYQVVVRWAADIVPRESSNGHGGDVPGDDTPRVVDDHTMRQFLSLIGHDLRTPLNGVLGMTRLLLDSGLRADQVEYARAIDTSGEQLLSVIEDLLEFATLDVKTALNPVDFDPRALVDDVMESLAWRAAEKEIEICALVSAKVPEVVEGDASRLRQILSYLVSDGIALTTLGDVVVRTALESEDPEDVLLRFDVGISGTVEGGSSAWAPAATRKTNLATDADVNPRAEVCRHLVRLMGGTMGAQVDALGGRTWWFTSRVKRRPLPVAAVTRYVPLAGKRVLCVDDNPVSQRLLLERLRGWNLWVESADEAHTALTLMKVASAAGTPFDLAILDLRLPGLDGLALARLIRSDPALAPTRLILLTGYPARGQAALAQEAGIDAYLQKPIREAPLRACLEALLAGGDTRQFVPLLTSRQLMEGRAGLRPRILVAEDNPLNQKVAVQMLERLGCRVDVVADGADAVEAVRRTPYHLVLMDCQMNGMDGVEAARLIRARLETAASPPIIALSGDSADTERVKCLDAGMNDFMQKPLRLNTLREKLAQWIEAAPR